MNIFYVDRSASVSARLLADVHVVKMILETAQMLSTAHRLTQESVPEVLYKTTHKNHPSSVWIRDSRNNYAWAYMHFTALSRQYTYRYGKTHLTWQKLGDILKYIPDLPDKPFTPPPLCMPDEYKVGDTVESYRWYYTSKAHSMGRPMTWTKTTRPAWFGENYVKMYGQGFYGPLFAND